MLEGKVKVQRNRGISNRYLEKDVVDWMRASVWRVGRTAEDRRMYIRSVKTVTSDKPISERVEHCHTKCNTRPIYNVL